MLITWKKGRVAGKKIFDPGLDECMALRGLRIDIVDSLVIWLFVIAAEGGEKDGMKLSNIRV